MLSLPAAWSQQGASPRAGAAPVPTPASETRDTRQLETVTVIGTGLPTEVMANPASITIISAEDIEQKVPTSIAALLRDVPGVQISEEGIERIAIRGETPRRVAILIDGQRLTDHTNYGQPVLVDPATIERIEIVRGASSVVSGSSAIGGVINIITKRGASQPFSFTATAGYFSATRGYRVSGTAAGTVPAGAGALDYTLSLGRMEQGDRRTPRGTLVPSDVEDRNVSGHLGYRIGAHYFGIRASAYDLGANVYVAQPDFSVSLPQRDLRKVGLFYQGTQLTPWLTRLDASLYRQTIERDFRSDATIAAGPIRNRVRSNSLDAQATRGASLRAEMKFSPGSRTVAGLEWEDDALVADKTTRSTRTPPGITTTVLRHDDAATRTFSLFGEHELTLAQRLTATLGARASRTRSGLEASNTNGVANPTRRSADSELLGSAALVWSPSTPLTLRANIAQGFIYPTLGQLFLTATGEGATWQGNPDLKPEVSTTYELGARHAAGGTVLDLTLFHMRSKDYITRVLLVPVGTYRNIDAARSTGVEVSAQHALGVWGLTPHAALAFMRRQLRFGNGLRTSDSGTPAMSGVIGLRRDWAVGEAVASVDVYLRGESRVRVRDATGASLPGAAGYTTLNLRASAQLPADWTLVAELNNLGNRRYQPYGQMPGAERSLNLFVTRKF